MSARRLRPAAAAAAVAALLGLAGPRPAAAAPGDGPAVARRLVETVAPAVVHVRVVIRAKASFQGQQFDIPEQEGDLVGLVVDPQGLVLAGSPMHMVRTLESRMPGLSISMGMDRPRVRLAGATDDLEAVLVAQDATLGLAYFHLAKPPATPLPAVDLAVGTTAVVGDELFGVRRLDRAFDDAPSVLRAHVAGAVEQPRVMGVLRGEFHEHGLPLFRADGTPAGVYAVQLGAEGGGDALDVSDMLGGLLPLETVRASLALARRKVPEALGKAREADAAASTPAPKDGAPAPKDGTPEPKDGTGTPPPGMG